MNLLLISNPTAGSDGGGMRLRRLKATLNGMGAHITHMPTQEAGHAERIAYEHDLSLFDRILIAGGDGTLNEVVNGLARRPDDHFNLPLVFAPFGTANVLAHELALDRSIDGMARRAVHGTPLSVTPGISNGRRFLLMVSAGLDSVAVAGIDPGIKQATGPLAYIWSGLKALGRFGQMKVTVSVDGAPAIDGVTVIITRGHKYGGPFITVPSARLEDDALHAVVFKRAGLPSLLGYAWGMSLGRLEHHPDIAILSGRTVRVETPADALPVQADGDITTATPLDVSLDSRPIRLVR